MTTSEQTTHYSKRDTWIVVVLWAAVASMVWTIVRLWVGRGPDVMTLVSTPLLGLAAWLSLSVLYGTRYELGDRALTIRSGPLRWRVSYDAIDEISPPDRLFRVLPAPLTACRYAMGSPAQVY